jgi:hypothetical protein
MTRTDVVRRDHVTDVHLARIQVDLDARDTRRPAECGIGVPAIRLVVEPGARVGLEIAGRP